MSAFFTVRLRDVDPFLLARSWWPWASASPAAFKTPRPLSASNVSTEALTIGQVNGPLSCSRRRDRAWLTTPGLSVMLRQRCAPRASCRPRGTA